MEQDEMIPLSHTSAHTKLFCSHVQSCISIKMSSKIFKTKYFQKCYKRKICCKFPVNLSYFDYNISKTIRQYKENVLLLLERQYIRKHENEENEIKRTEVILAWLRKAYVIMIKADRLVSKHARKI